MKLLPPKIALVASLALASSPALLPAASFGPGRAQLIAGGGGEVLLDSPSKEVALRFVAERAGPLGAVRFASRVGQGWTDPAANLFAVALLDDNAGAPGRRVAAATTIPATAPGARAREAVFDNVPLKAGQAYYLVISVPGDGGAHQISVNYYLFDASAQPLDSYDMDTAAPGGDVLVSEDGGATWASVGQGTAGAMALTIGGRLQGWAYTNSYDARLWHAPGGDQQVLMQNFRFTTGGKGGAGRVGSVLFQLRAQGGLAGVSVPLRVRLLDMAGKAVGAATLTVAAGDAGRFFIVSAPFKNTVLKDGTDYVLSIDIPDATGTGPGDFLFMRTFTWGFGNPSLDDVSWQGGEHSLIQSPTLEAAAGQPFSKVDMPFILDYTAVR